MTHVTRLEPVRQVVKDYPVAIGLQIYPNSQEFDAPIGKREFGSLRLLKHREP